MHEKSEDQKKEVKAAQQGFPAGSVVSNPPASAADTGSTPDLGRCHKPRGNQVGPWAATIEPKGHNYESRWALEPMLRQQKKPPQREPTRRIEEPSRGAAMKTQHSQKK